MTDGYLQIRYETLQQAQTDLGMAYAAARTAIEDLTRQLDRSLAGWSGEARAAYDQVKADWERSFAHMAQVLSRAQVHMGSAHEMYQQVERQNTSIWR